MKKKLLLKNKKLAVVMLFALFYLAFFYTANDILEGGVELTDLDDSEKKVPDIKPATVSFLIESGNYKSSHRIALDDSHTILDVLENLREDGVLSYEQIYYTAGLEIVEINNVAVTQNTKWNFYEDGVLVADPQNYKIKDNGIYIARLELKP